MHIRQKKHNYYKTNFFTRQCLFALVMFTLIPPPENKNKANKKIQAHLHLPMILIRFLDLDWILLNLPVKSLGSNMSMDREAIRSRKIPSWPWLWFSTSWSCPWLRDWPSQGSEAPLSAPRLLVLLTSSRDISPRSLPLPGSPVKTWPFSELARRHYMMVQRWAQKIKK